jgi:hypothetical protein
MMSPDAGADFLESWVMSEDLDAFIARRVFV